MVIKPSRSLYSSKILDEDSISLIKDIFKHKSVDCSQLQIGCTLADIDGYLELCDEEGRSIAKLTVQVKHITIAEDARNICYDVPISLYGYCKVHKGEVVIFIACDTKNERFFWMHINNSDVDEVEQSAHSGQQTWRVHFSQDAVCTRNNSDSVIKEWIEIYDERINSFRDLHSSAEHFVREQRLAFNSIQSEFHGLSGSHIHRNQVNELQSWLLEESNDESDRICLLIGNAGVGKSVVLKDLIILLEARKIKHICIKADSIDDNNNPVSLHDIQNAISCYAANHEKVVLIIDQIDALSQSLSNDRNKLNNLISILSSLHNWPEVNAIVSCRSYDLEYDQTLNGLKANAKIIELGKLSKEEVCNVLDRIDNSIKESIDSKTLSLLGTAQYLNTYCFLCNKSKSIQNFSSSIQLYDALWSSCLQGAPTNVLPENIEYVLFEVARRINDAETLKPTWVPDRKYESAFAYLASCGLILKDESCVSFFHQTFFDYSLARLYVSKSKSFITELEGKFQGLELRSTVKAVLDYERGHDPEFFVKDIQRLLTSLSVRLHLKLLAISVLASQENPIKEEKAIIRDVCSGNIKLLVHFLRGVSSNNWFKTTLSIVKQHFPETTREHELYQPILVFLSRYSYPFPSEVFKLIKEIKDEDSRYFAISYILREHNDYRNSHTIDAFNMVVERYPYFTAEHIQDMLLTNPSLAFTETSKLISQYLESEHNGRSKDGYELVEVLCKRVYSNFPKEFLLMLHSCIVEIIRKTSIEGVYGYSTTRIFSGLYVEDYTRKLLEMYEDALIKNANNANVIMPIVTELIALNDETSLSMAYIAMSEYPKMYDSVIRTIVESDQLLNKNLHCSLDFFLIKLLKAWCSTLDETTLVWYQNRLLSYKSPSDFISKGNSFFERGVFPYLWYDKWKLICNSLPDHGITPEMKRCSQELSRRYHGRIEVKRKKNYVTCASFCGGVVDDNVYLKWSLKNWLNSFLKLDENKRWRDDLGPISLHSHADAFKNCVAKNPRFYVDFVKDISTRKDIQTLYKVAGIKGLLEGGIDLHSAWCMVKPFITVDYAEEDSYSFGQIVGHYMKVENEYIDTIVPILQSIIVKPFEKTIEDEPAYGSRHELETKANNLITAAINSKQGKALEALINMSRIPERRKQSYSIISELAQTLDNSLKTLPLHYLYVQGCFDSDLYFPLMKSLIQNMGAEALWLRADAIQWCYYHKNDTVRDFIDRSELDNRSHEILVQIFFYGLCNSDIRQDCEKRLDKIFASGDENAIAKIVEVAMKMYSKPEYSRISRAILERFASDTRESVANAYCYYSKHLPADAFDFYRSISNSWNKRKHREIHDQLEYVTKCIQVDPVGCYKFIKEQDYSSIEDVWTADDEVVKILLKIYNKMRQDEYENEMNELMDLFDDYIYRGNRVLRDALSKMDSMISA